MKHITAAAAATIAGALLIGGCASATPSPGATTPAPSSPASSTPAGTAGPLATVDTLFGPVEIPQPADGELTVVALGWSDAEIALALGVQPVAVYDWQGFGEANKGVGPWATTLFGETTPAIIANVGDELDYETIQTLDP
ncbi:MAG: hypothetical protein KIT69_20120, partial [Propionibacteriaceae bacterium]|nr:hypothetical protein [Propionibacteriaceae bacterium]